MSMPQGYHRILQKNKRAEASGIFTAAGLTVVIDIPLGPTWEVIQMAVSTNGTVTPSDTSTYIGRNSSGIFISSTFLGTSDTDSLPNVTVRSGESLCAVWQPATVGDLGKLTVIYNEVDY